MSVTGTVVTVGGWQVVVLWSVLLEQRVWGEVGGISTSSENDGTVLGVLEVIGQSIGPVSVSFVLTDLPPCSYSTPVTASPSLINLVTFAFLRILTLSGVLSARSSS